MNLLLTCLISLISAFCTYAQTNKTDCNCPKNTIAGTVEGREPDTTFYFSSKHTIILCGSKDTDHNETYFSEFILQRCKQDTIIGFWGATQTCRLSMLTDTLRIVDLKNLPTDVNRKYKLTDWSIENIYFSKGQIIRSINVNSSIRKYTEPEIQETLREYQATKSGLDENKMELANKLFIATISGNNIARQYFKEFKTRFGTLDGAFAEEYSDLVAMLVLWDKMNN